MESLLKSRLKILGIGWMTLLGRIEDWTRENGGNRAYFSYDPQKTVSKRHLNKTINALAFVECEMIMANSRATRACGITVNKVLSHVQPSFFEHSTRVLVPVLIGQYNPNLCFIVL